MFDNGTYNVIKHAAAGVQDCIATRSWLLNSIASMHIIILLPRLFSTFPLNFIVSLVCIIYAMQLQLVAIKFVIEFRFGLETETA